MVIVFAFFRINGSSSAAAASTIIKSGVSGYCLDDYKDGSTPNNKVDSWKCNGSSAQSWTIKGDTIVHALDCLSVEGDSQAGNAPVVVNSCSEAPGQVWLKDKSGYYNPNSGLCLNSPSDNQQLTVADCNTAADPSQSWTASGSNNKDAVDTSCHGTEGQLVACYAEQEWTTWQSGSVSHIDLLNKYTDNASYEAWCADFVSYVYKEAGYPFTQAYAGWDENDANYIQNYNFTLHAASSGYVPKAGDIGFFDYNGGHVEIVVSGGKTPTFVYGNSATLDPTTDHRRNIAPDPDKAPLVIKLFGEAATGAYSLDEIWRYARDKLNLTSRTGKPMPKQTLQDLLRNTLYHGIFRHGGEYHKGSYEPLISIELYDKVQFAMGWRSKKIRNSTRGYDYMLKGVFVCGTCGHNLTAYTKEKVLKSGRPASYVFYVCTRKSKSIKCKDPQIAEADLIKQVHETIAQIRINKQEAAFCIKLLRKFHSEQVANRNTMLEVWKWDNAEARRNADELLEMRIKHEINSEQYATYKQRYEEILDRTNQLIGDSNHNANDWLELAENFFSGLVTLETSFDAASDENKRRMLLNLGLNWELKNKTVLFTPRKPYDLLLNRTEKSNWRARPDSNRRSPP
ncbi:unnamed protein product [Sphagnum balticum]